MSPVPLPATLTVVGVLAALVAPGLAAGPASAADPCATPRRYVSQARADLLRIDANGVHTMGQGTAPAGLRMASTFAGMVTDSPITSAAAARPLGAWVLGGGVPPDAPLASTVWQQAPPHHAAPALSTAGRRDVGPIRIGTGDMAAHATWHTGLACGTRAGRTAHASTAVAGVQIAPKPGGGALLAAEGTLGSDTTTALVAERGMTRATATAAAGIAELGLFTASRSPVRLRVVKAPTLTVGTAGTESTTTIAYESPVVEVSGAGLPAQTLDQPGKSVEFPVPALAGVPTVPGAPAPTVRISLGQVERHTAAGTVRARTTALRVQVTPAARGRTASTEGPMDLAIGVLEAMATAPGPGYAPAVPGQGGPGSGRPVTGQPVPGGGQPSSTAPEAGGEAPEGGTGGAGPRAVSGGGLPLTGSPLGLIMFGGGLLVVTGGIATVLARRGLLFP